MAPAELAEPTSALMLSELNALTPRVLYQDIGYKKVSGHRLQKFQDIGNTFG